MPSDYDAGFDDVDDPDEIDDEIEEVSTSDEDAEPVELASGECQTFICEACSVEYTLGVLTDDAESVCYCPFCGSQRIELQ